MEGQRTTSKTKGTYEQLCESLVDVEHAAKTIFDTISNRVSMEHVRLNGLSCRIRSAKDKISKISGTNRATTLFSSPKYPSKPTEVSSFVPLFREPLKVKLSTNHGGLQDSDEGTIELFRFFSETSHEYMLDALKQKVGLGSVPSDAKSVADLFLFNSTELPYSNYRVMDNLEDAQQPTKETGHNNTIVMLPPPPQSILQSGSLCTSELEEYGFRPIVRQVPSFSLPSSLPHLPMVAEISWKDSRYGDDNSLSIACSAVDDSRSANPAEFASPNADKSVKISREGSEETPYDDTKNKRFQPPPPPPLPPPSTRPFSSVNDSEAGSPSNAQERVTSFAQASSPAHRSFAFGNVSSPGGSPLPHPDSQRSALMASIRNPAIALRKTSPTSAKASDLPASPMEHNQDAKGQNQQIPSRKQPVDILTEMATTLKLRRLSMQGIASEKDKSDREEASKHVIQSEDDAMESTVEAYRRLPPPMPNLKAYITQVNKGLSSDDEEWDD